MLGPSIFDRVAVSEAAAVAAAVIGPLSTAPDSFVLPENLPNTFPTRNAPKSSSSVPGRNLVYLQQREFFQEASFRSTTRDFSIVRPVDR